MEQDNNPTKIYESDARYSTTRSLSRSISAITKLPGSRLNRQLVLPPTKFIQGQGGLRTKGLFKHNQAALPLITAITVVYNGEKHLSQTIDSVISQQYENVEYIIIDGGSTDRTLEIIKQHEHVIDYWISEKDAGIYSAMNKGLELATGEIIFFLNADDWLTSNAFRSAIDNFDKNLSFLAGAVNVVNEASNTTSKSLPMELARIKIPGLQEMPFPHQGLFVRRAVFEFLGPFDLKYKIVADMEFVCRMIKAGLTGRIIDLSLANYRDNGQSSSDLRLLEEKEVAIRYGKSNLMAYCRRLITLVKKRFYKFLPIAVIRFLCRIVGSRHLIDT